MKKSYLISIILAILLNAHAYSQQADSLKQVHINYLSKTLSISQSKAKSVVAILDEYKENAKKVISDNSQSEDARKLKLNQLIDVKNSSLEKILTEEQLKKIIPTSERRNNKTGKSTNPS